MLRANPTPNGAAPGNGARAKGELSSYSAGRTGCQRTQGRDAPRCGSTPPAAAGPLGLLFAGAAGPLAGPGEPTYKLFVHCMRLAFSRASRIWGATVITTPRITATMKVSDNSDRIPYWNGGSPGFARDVVSWVPISTAIRQSAALLPNQLHIRYKSSDM